MNNITTEVVITSAARTATGRFQGGLSTLKAPEIGAIAIKEAVKRAGIEPASIDEVIMGNVVSAGLGQAPARQAMLKAGIPDHVSAITVNKVCGSALQAVMFAAQAIKAGDAQILVAGGMESMSNGPYLLPGARNGYRYGHGQLIDSVLHDALWCSYENQAMGNSAEAIAGKYNISRQEQDQFALESHRKASAAIAAGKFAGEIVPVLLNGSKGTTLTIETDEPVRHDTSLALLAKLNPAFVTEGTVTAGNAPGLSDGASAVVVMSASAARDAGVKPLARIIGYSTSACAPLWLFEAPTLAINKLLAQTGLTLQDFDLLEINEAFSAQILANGKVLDWDWAKVNVNGGAVALGHAVGSSGTRILTTLLYALQDRGGKYGLAALCLGGGGAVAMAVELL